MTLTQLNILSFKSYLESSYDFESGINCVVGKNGKGKTNLLDAIHYLAFAKGAFPTTDAQNMHHGSTSFTIHGRFLEDVMIGCQYTRKGKTLKVNGEEVKKISNHVGCIPLVMTTPDDSDIIREGSEYRRRFFDEGICQLDRMYLENLMAYQSLLRQRNEHLKLNERSNRVNHTLLDTYDAQLLPLAKSLANRREAFVKEFHSFFEVNYSKLFPGEETPKIRFRSDALHDQFESRYRGSRERDILMKRTLMGIHKDQYEFVLNELPIKKFGSQGQQKTFIIALKLAEYDMLKAGSGRVPLLLLDDIFDKLDDERILALVKILGSKKRFEQVFITDARAERSRAFFAKTKVNFIELP